MSLTSRYGLVTPVRNEEATVEITIASVLRQTIRPLEWVIVSDNSTDRTHEIVASYTQREPWIHFLPLTNRPERNFASVVFVLETGYRALPDRDYDFIGLLDADVRFAPDYYERLMARFAEHPQLGLAGGWVRDVVNGQFHNDTLNTREVAGATQFFRRDCFESLNGLVPVVEGGWDTITGIQARMNGYETRTFPDLVMEHLKPRNAAFGHPFRGHWQFGVRDYAVAIHPLFELAKCASRLGHRPFLLGAFLRFLGYSWSCLSRRPRIIGPDLVAFSRREQLQRLRRLPRRPRGADV